MKRQLNDQTGTCNTDQSPKSRRAGIGMCKPHAGAWGSDRHRMFAHGGIVASGITIVLATTSAFGQLVSTECWSTLDTHKPVPGLRQSNAHLVSVECCFPAVELLRIGECMSGPGQAFEPETCGFSPRCTVGFSEPVGPGDFLYGLCGTGPPDPPDAADAFCTSWYVIDEPVAEMCEVSPAIGAGSFVTFDSDGDNDIDLADFAVFQTELGSPTELRSRFQQVGVAVP